ncbi:mandelate racemase/muconate lactonizing enzyme family protein [Roseovarius sp. Pro17]|uniref:mandelate racemase/muconate lactonizing enzyme family protein n=1 Tax=Roseovarius sp. Pro17 TaxID=3108175 RepID=UPI002D79FC3E|nr:enolase C-terminal domain-like protein [Roseovarius sp. Pro17]
MKITALNPQIIQLPGSSDYTWRSLEVPIGRYVILRIETDDGITGLGEAPAILSWGGENQRYAGEDPEIVCHLVKFLSPKLIGRDPTDIKGALAMMDEGVRGFPYTKAMIESALLDITGKAAGIPVYQLLGGAARTSIPVCHSVGVAAPEKAADMALRVVEDGIKHLQIKVPGDPATDLAIVKAIRKAVGDDIDMHPDINRGYKDAKTAINSARAMTAEAGIWAIEQPVEGIDMMARITAAVDIPVIVDEGCWTPFDAMEIARRNSADILSIYFTKAGGLIRSMEIGAIGRAAGMPMNVNGSLEGGVGNAANLHLSAALEGQVLPGVITVNTLKGREQTKVGGVFYTDDVIAEPFAYADGCLTVPNKPGLGVELDEDKMKKYRVS